MQTQSKQKLKGLPTRLLFMFAGNANGKQVESAVVQYRLYQVFVLIGRVHVYRFIRLSKNKCRGQMQVVNHWFANIFFQNRIREN